MLSLTDVNFSQVRVGHHAVIVSSTTETATDHGGTSL